MNIQVLNVKIENIDNIGRQRLKYDIINHDISN